jgi:hypothetical protein
MRRQPDQCAHPSQRSVERPQWPTTGARDHFLQRLDEYRSVCLRKFYGSLLSPTETRLERCPHLNTRLMRTPREWCRLRVCTCCAASFQNGSTAQRATNTVLRSDRPLQHCAWARCYVCYIAQPLSYIPSSLESHRHVLCISTRVGVRIFRSLSRQRRDRFAQPAY